MDFLGYLISNKTYSYIIKDKIKNIEIDNQSDLDYLKFCLKGNRI